MLSIVPVTEQTAFFALICMLAVLTFFTPSPMAVLVVFLGMCQGLIVALVVFAALPFKKARVSQEKPQQLTVMEKKTRLKEISEGAFDGLSQLRFLRVERNEICSLSTSNLKHTYFRNALSEVKPRIELLDFSGNCFPTTPAQNLRNCVKLMYLDLPDKISEISNFELMNLPHLKELRLQNDQLSEIHPMAFMNVPQLRYLYMRDILIGSLDGNRLQAFHRLEILDVTNDILQKDLRSLKQVRLDGNLIEKIGTLAFSNNPNLQVISIQNNNIVQVARNSFDSLDQLLVLLLANNSIQRGILDGVRNLQQLSLRNNSLSSVDEDAFASLRELTTLDLAHNSLRRSRRGRSRTRRKCSRWTFRGTSWPALRMARSTRKSPTFFSMEIRCSAMMSSTGSCGTYPKSLVPVQRNTSVLDLMTKKTNDTLTEGMKTLGFNEQGQCRIRQLFRSLTSALIPGLRGAPTAAQRPCHIQDFQAIPAMRNMPRIDVRVQPGAETVVNPNLNSAIEQFTAPLVRFDIGGQPVASDIEQLIQSILNFIVNVPGLGNVDISKLDPNFVAHVLRGSRDQIPGIPKERLDGIVQQHMLKMHEAAAAAQSGRMVKYGEKVHL
ncbi:unnamed protein product [Heligmosomoides polygyrus]|uniref:Uncharacterized protein n=1 Tax=Heligmosomoides polygyrus TaxID=6339 RepID=A0A3P8AN29_HELPZ|nr:unnamed protein product [Heligmosomoides polygyrus]